MYIYKIIIYECYAYFVMKRDLKFYDYVHLNGRLWRAVYNNVQALVTFFLACNISIDSRNEFKDICGRTIKFNRQNKMFVHVLALGYH